MDDIVKQNEKLFKSNKVCEVNKYQYKLKKYNEDSEYVYLNLPSLSSNIDKGRELIVDIGYYRALLKQMFQPCPSANISHLTTGIGEAMDQAVVVATIPSKQKGLLCCVACVGGGEAWISGDHNTIIRIDIHGTVQNTVITKYNHGPRVISVTRRKELVYSGCNSRTVEIARNG